MYPYYFTFTTFTKGRWVGEKILEVFAREFRAHPAEEYERCIRAGTLTVNYQKVDVDYRLRHNDLLANVVHRYVPIRRKESVPAAFSRRAIDFRHRGGEELIRRIVAGKPLCVRNAALRRKFD